MNSCKLFVVIFICFAVEVSQARDHCVISNINFSCGNISDWTNCLQGALTSQVSTNYIVTLNYDLPDIIVPSCVTGLVGRLLYDETISSLKKEIETNRKVENVKMPLRYVTLDSLLCFLDEVFSSQSEVNGYDVTVRLFPSRLQFMLYDFRAGRRIGFMPFSVASPFSRVKAIFLGEKGNLILAPPELHQKSHQLLKELEGISSAGAE